MLYVRFVGWDAASLSIMRELYSRKKRAMTLSIGHSTLAKLTNAIGSTTRQLKYMQIQPYDGNCPKNVAKDAKYSIRSGGDRFVVALTYATSGDEIYRLALEDHYELIEMVNSVKVALTGKPNGSFYINEFGHVIVPVVGSSDYFFAGVYRRPLIFEFDSDKISGLPIRPDGSTLSPETYGAVHASESPTSSLPVDMIFITRPIHVQT